LNISSELLEKYNFLKGLVVSDRKDSFNACMKCLEENTLWLTAPASSKFHSAKESGLLEHSILVTLAIIKLKKTFSPEITDEQCVIVGLLHDIGKVGNSEMPMYIAGKQTEKQKLYGYPSNDPYGINDNLQWMEIEDRSLYLATVGCDFKFEEEEYAAIRYHSEPWKGQSSVYRKNKLMTLLQMSDYWNTQYVEETK